MFKRLLATAALCGVVSGAQALERADAVGLLVDLHRMDVDTSMMIYDEQDTAVQDSLRRRLAALDPRIEVMVAEVTRASPDDGERLAEDWRTVHRSLDGDGTASGMMSSGYDGNAFAEYRTALGELVSDLNERNALAANGSTEEQALLLGSRIIAIYVRTAASPFGSYSDNNDATIGEDLVGMSKRFDGMVDVLVKKHANDAKQGPVVKRLATKWNFIRSAVVQYAQRSMPTVVSRQGKEIIDQLAKLQ